MKSKLPINTKCLALRYKSIIKCPLQDALSWAKDNYLKYVKYEGTHYKDYRREFNGPYLEKEFKFRGYVPLDSFTKEPGYNYLQSNFPINGTMYVYPKKLCRRYDLNYKDNPNPYNYQLDAGISGYTRVDVNYKL